MLDATIFYESAMLRDGTKLSFGLTKATIALSSRAPFGCALCKLWSYHCGETLCEAFIVTSFGS